MAINLKKFTIAMVGLFAFFLCMPTTHALEEAQTQDTATTEDTSRWEAIQPVQKVTSEGLIVDYDFSNFSYVPGGWINTGSSVTVTITIPENYELDTLVIAPDVFTEIANVIYGEGNDNLEMNNTLQSGDKIIIDLVINNLSKYTYNYDETSFEIFPNESIVYDKLTEENPSVPTEDAPLFNGGTVNENYHVNRTYNTALRALIPNSSNAAMTDERIDTALRAANYINGFADYTQYLLDFYNDKYHTNYTRLDQFPDGIIREILGEGDPFLTVNSAYRAAKVTYIGRSDTIEDILYLINRNNKFGKTYQSVEDYILDYYNDEYGTNATRLVDLCDEALDDFFSSQGTETGSPYNLETNPDVIALSYDYFYNKGLAWGFEEDEYSHDDSEDLAIGEYMRDESKGDEYIKENAGTLTSNGSGKVNGTLYTSGPYVLNAYLGYEFGVNMQWTYSALKGTVIAQYVDIFGNVLADDVITSDMVGKDYQTYLKYFDGYQLVTINGEETGKYIDGEIVVVYVYAPTIPEDIPGLETGSTDGWEIEPPKTGIKLTSSTNNTAIAIIAIISTIGLVTVTTRKREQ